jgi:hypothetical protein
LEGCLTLVAIDMAGWKFAVDVIVCQYVMMFMFDDYDE